jgi:hypothetical protein
MSLSFDIDEKFNCYQYDQNERDNPEKALKQGLFNYLFDSSVNHLSRRYELSIRVSWQLGSTMIESAPFHASF